jgi:DNA repair protein RecO (recombination protein O)
VKTVSRGIVLKSVDYGDNGAVVKIYTHNYGMRAFLFRGVKGKRKKTALLQPLSLVELAYTHHPNRDLVAGAEARILEPYQTLYGDVRKSMIALFLAEMLFEILKSDQQDEALFDFIQSRLTAFDLDTWNPNFHLCFLAKLTRPLGFYPQTTSVPVSFNPTDGVFSPRTASAGDLNNAQALSVFQRFFTDDIQASAAIEMGRNTRRQLLELMIRYYQHHTPAMREIQSLQVLMDVLDD